MPLIHITTSAEHPEPRAADELLGALSKLLAGEFGKPEQWVMTCLAPRAQMTFGGTREPTCYVEIKNIGTLEAHHAEALSQRLCEQLSRSLGVSSERIYIEFTDAIGRLWGWNGTTFA
jgi:phenylpyruvate tautomerase PptA (4-oxalocrotonate tautomerase family)